jgi:hypothetical protein
MSSFRGDIGPPPLSGTHRIVAWAPGTEIRFEKPRSFAFFLHLPLTLMVFAGPAMWVAMGRRQLAAPDLKGQFWLSLVVGLVGVWLGRSNFAAARRALRETIAFDWPSGSLRISGRRTVEIPLAAITAIEVRGVWAAFSSRTESDMSDDRIIRFRCQLWAHHGASTTPTPTELVATEFIEEGRAAAMREASTVAEELAAALGVEHPVTDYPPVPRR